MNYFLFDQALRRRRVVQSGGILGQKQRHVVSRLQATLVQFRKQYSSWHVAWGSPAYHNGNLTIYQSFLSKDKTSTVVFLNRRQRGLWRRERCSRTPWSHLWKTLPPKSRITSGASNPTTWSPRFCLTPNVSSTKLPTWAFSRTFAWGVLVLPIDSLTTASSGGKAQTKKNYISAPRHKISAIPIGWLSVSIR